MGSKKSSADFENMNRTMITKYNSHANLHKQGSMQFNTRDMSPLNCNEKGGASISDHDFPTPRVQVEADSQPS